MRRWGVLAATAALALVIVTSAQAALFFLFDPTSATPGQRVTVRLGGTPAGFTLDRRQRPFQPPLRVYLVPDNVAAEVKSRFDPRLQLVGRLVPDRRGRGVLSFRVPPLDTDTYVAAAWCPGCARFSGGSSFFTLPLPQASRYRQLMSLRLELPAASAESCPVTRGSYGNGFLSTRVPGPNGVLATRKDAGALFQKLWWEPHRGLTGELTVRGERLDAPGTLRVLAVNWGSSSAGGGSWASAVAFPSEGCWRLTGRVRDVSLTYVVSVVEGCGDTYTPPPCGPTARSSSSRTASIAR
jgi:hypothetical protein